MPDQFDDNADWSRCEKKNDLEEEKRVSRHCRLSPINSLNNSPQRNRPSTFNENQNDKMQYYEPMHDLNSFSPVPDHYNDNADLSSCERNDSEEEKQKHVSYRHCRSSPTNSIVNVLTTSSPADNGDDADSMISSVVSEAPTFDCRRSFIDITQQLDQFDDISDCKCFFN
uniref:Uncharacterized protein n=1 Tax=Panagrolaimus davidi TaxID=227884 RepID=A0A914QJ42_9BILA